MRKQRVEIHVGALVPSISEQLAEQGLRLPHDDAKNYQGWADALVRLSIAGLVTERERSKVGQRIVKALAKRVKPQ